MEQPEGVLDFSLVPDQHGQLFLERACILRMDPAQIQALSGIRPMRIRITQDFIKGRVAEPGQDLPVHDLINTKTAGNAVKSHPHLFFVKRSALHYDCRPSFNFLRNSSA